MKLSITQAILFSTFLVATAHAQWTPTNATTNDPIAHANDITVTGNVAVDNATLKPWAAGKALQGRSGAFFLGRVGDTHMTSNAYYSGVSGEGWNYMAAGNAANMYFYNGDIIFRTAVSGAADAVLSWSNPVQIKNNGSVLFGMAQNSTSSYTLDVNGTERVGSVAIGGTSSTVLPPQKLTVYGGHIALDNTAQLIGRDAGNTFYSRLIGNDGANRILLGDNTSSVANEVRFHTNGGSSPTMLINTAGNVGIGTVSPVHRLTVSGGHAALDNGMQLIGRDAGNTFYFRLIGNDGANRIVLGDSTSSIANEVRFHTNGGASPTMLINTAGNVGIGVLAPAQRLSVAGTIESTSGGFKFPDGTVQTSANTSTNGSLTASNTAGDATVAAVASTGVAYIRLASAEATPLKDWRVGLLDNSGIFKVRDNVAAVDRMTINGSSIHFNGNVDGTTIQATYQDVAEWVPAAEAMTVGTVVVVDDNANNTVTASTHAYDTSVAGVVSPNPGLLLGVASASKAKIATTGRVRVRVDATKSPIRKGDLLVTSDRPGMAMRSEPLDLGGVKIHRPGTLIGKALEPLATGEGEILVLLSLQ